MGNRESRIINRKFLLCFEVVSVIVGNIGYKAFENSGPVVIMLGEF
jgi:hypothetical protein